MNYPVIKLNDKGLKNYLNQYLWFTSKDIINFRKISKNLEPGSLVKIVTKENHFLGIGYFNPESYFSLKILTKYEEPINKDFFLNCFNKALRLRKIFYPYEKCFRLIFSEGDFLPGLIIDIYEKVIIVQIQTLGMEKLKNYIISALIELFNPKAIILKNNSTRRKEEKLDLYTEIVYGKTEDPILVNIDGIKFLIPIKQGQKTGFFLDQRENRRFIVKIAEKQTLIDVFSYIGGFSFYALKGGAKKVFLIDRSSLALDIAEEIAKINNWKDKIITLHGDAFQILKNPPKTDIIVLDPPAFIKSQKDFSEGEKKYKFLYFLGLKVIEKGFFFAFSCSYFLKIEMLWNLIKINLNKLNKKGKVIYQGGQAPDHPINPFVEETSYLKGLGLYII